jgi:membrane-associated phospholipid phosphatase
LASSFLAHGRTNTRPPLPDAPVLPFPAAPSGTQAIIPARWIILGIVTSALVVGLLMIRAGLTLIMPAAIATAIGLALVAASAAHFRLRHPAAAWQHIARDAIEYVALFAAICLIGAVASYAVAANSTGFVDRSLATMDHILRFDWLRWYAFEVAHPAIEPLARAAYQSIFITPAILLGYFACSGRKADARRFIASFWLGACITLLLFVDFPAEGPLAFLWHGRIPYMPESALYQRVLIPALRDHAVHTVPLMALRGLVGAPSFHTVSALLYVAAAWPIARLRWPVLVLNAAMLLATPVEGTHYLTDMLAGALVAIGAWTAVTLLTPKLLARHPDESQDPLTQPIDQTEPTDTRSTLTFLRTASAGHFADAESIDAAMVLESRRRANGS